MSVERAGIGLRSAGRADRGRKIAAADRGRGVVERDRHDRPPADRPRVHRQGGAAYRVSSRSRNLEEPPRWDARNWRSRASRKPISRCSPSAASNICSPMPAPISRRSSRPTPRRRIPGIAGAEAAARDAREPRDVDGARLCRRLGQGAGGHGACQRRHRQRAVRRAQRGARATCRSCSPPAARR